MILLLASQPSHTLRILRVCLIIFQTLDARLLRNEVPTPEECGRQVQQAGDIPALPTEEESFGQYDLEAHAATSSVLNSSIEADCSASFELMYQAWALSESANSFEFP